MRIYLADLFHGYVKNVDTAPCTVPLGIGFIASAIKKEISGSEVRLFRDPTRFIEAVKSEPPEIVGFTFTSWTTDLSRRAATLVKKYAPGAVTVAGGPCVDDKDEGINQFFDDNDVIDFVVPNEGETGMVALLRRLQGGWRPNGTGVPGVAYRDEAGRLIRGNYEMPLVNKGNPKEVRDRVLDDEVPSPILDGTLDSFLAEGLVPIIQTMRGCPYQCEFCVSGMTAWNKLRGFDLTRVKAEIDYVLDRGGTKDLILTDENWGVLGDRDIEVARHIMDRSRSIGAPARLYYYTTKIVTDTSRAIVEMVAPIAWIGEFTMSFQSLNPETRKAIKRTNITLDKLAYNVAWANERGIITSSEMIYGFPYETPKTFFDGVEALLEAGMHQVLIYPLQLFAGIDLATPEARERYGFQTRFRLADTAYGLYADGQLPSVETEEVIVGTKWSTFADYFKVRRYSFFLTGLLGRLYFTELFSLCAQAGFQPLSVFQHLAFMDYAEYPELNELLADFDRAAADELKESPAEVFESVVEKLRRGEPLGGVKLNLIYLAKLFGSQKALGQLLAIVSGYFEEKLTDHPHRDVLRLYLKEVLPNRIAVLDARSPKKTEFGSSFDYERWFAKNYRDLSDLVLPQPRRWRAVLDDVLGGNLEGLEPSDPASLQGLMDHTPKKKLLRTVAPVTA